MLKLKIAILFTAAVYWNCAINPNASLASDSLDSLLTPISVIENAYSNQLRDISVTVKGDIKKY